VAKCVQEKRDCGSCKVAARYLVDQVREGKTQAMVELAYRQRFLPQYKKEIDLSGSPSKGSPSAPITIVEWADFECPMCQRASPVLSEVVKENEDVRLVFKNFPLSMHENSENAARAAMAADVQGKFWEMHAALFSSQVPLAEPTLLQFAKDLGLDVAQFKKDLHSERVADAVARDKKQGEEVNLSGTPTIYVNGRLFGHATDLKSDLLSWIALERQLVESEAPAERKPVAKKESKSGDEAANSGKAPEPQP
jgi:protein-disulfide isomerase